MCKRITIAELFEAKRAGRKITAVSCYGYTMARYVSQVGVEMLLVGDSAAQVVLGFGNTLSVGMDFMVALTGGVRRGAEEAFLVADMPFLSYQAGWREAVQNSGRFFKESGVQMVKIESSRAYLDVIKAISDAGMPVMAHIGIKPQYVSSFGRFKAEATTAEQGEELMKLADEMVDAGASTLLLEGTAAEVAGMVTNGSEVPVIGCGSGGECDGQILILPDILGLTQGPKPRFAKSYGNLGKEVSDAVSAYCRDVKEGRYPDSEHSYHMKKGEFERLREMLGKQ